MLAAGVAFSARPQPLLAVRSPLSPRRPQADSRRRPVVVAKASAKSSLPSEDSDDSSDVVSSSSSAASAPASSSAAASSSSFASPRAVRPLNPSSRPKAASAPASPAPAPIRARLPTTLPALPFPALDVLVPGQTKRLHLFEARYLALLDEALARRDGCFAHVVAEPVSSLRASPSYYDVTEEYTRFQSNSSSSSKSRDPDSSPPPPLVVGAYALRLATLARVVDVRRPPASSGAPGALVTIRGEARLALLSLEDDAPYLRVKVEAAPDAVPTAAAVCGESGCEVEEDEGEAEDGDINDDEEEEALVAAVLARGAQEVEALLWDVVNLSYKLPRQPSSNSGNNGGGAGGNNRRGSSNSGLRIIGGSGRRFGDGEDEDEEEEQEEEEEAPLSPDPTGTIAALQGALNWAGDVPGLTPLSLSSSSSSSVSSSVSVAAPAPSSSLPLSPLAAAAERGARLGFAALQQVPHAGSPESLRGLAEARAAAMETRHTAERLRMAADFLRGARAELAAKAALKALQLG